MDYLGMVETVSGEGRFVVKAGCTPENGDSVYTADGKRIGTVKRIFGPVDGPYVTVIAAEGTDIDGMVGKEVYLKGEAKHGKDKRRH